MGKIMTGRQGSRESSKYTELFEELRRLVKHKSPAEIAAESGLPEGTAKKLRYGTTVPVRLKHENLRLLTAYRDALLEGRVRKGRDVPRETIGRNGADEPDVRAALAYVASQGLDGWRSERMIAEIAALYRAAAAEWEGRAATRRAELGVLAEQGARSREQAIPGVTPAEIQDLLQAGRALSEALQRQAAETEREQPPKRTGTD